MALSEAERSALTQVLDASTDLDRWRLRAHRVEQPERGSELAVDDEIFQWMPISELARMSLVAAGEHLRLALDAVNAKQLYPSAHFTALRGALVGASQAVWMLAPQDRETRRERGMTVLTEMYTQMDKYYASLATPRLTPDASTRLADQQSWLSGRRSEVASIRTGKADLNLTDVTATAADYAFADDESRDAVRRLWREMSGDSHVLGWAMLQRAVFERPDRRTGIGEGKALGSPEHVAEAFLTGYRLLRIGWSLFDRRCEAP